MEEPSNSTKSVSTQRPPKTNTTKTGGNRIALLLLACLSAGFVGGWFGNSARPETSLQSSNQAQREVISSEGQLISSIAKDVGESVVSIDVQSQSAGQDFFGYSRSVEQQSAGTGFIISSDGVVVTNRHVIPRGTTGISVTLSDGTKLDNVEVIGRTLDSDSLDVAFLKITDKKGKTLKPAVLGDSSKVEVGNRVIAIGNALGQFQNTVTSGIISGYGRDIVAGGVYGGDQESLTNLFQTDAAINEGNSGGPLVNTNSEVIGINTAVAAGQAQNIGFAIPINDIKGLITSVLEKGKLEKPYMGVRYVSLTDDLAYELNLETKRGAYLAPAGQTGQPTVLPDSPAAKAGLKEKDIITKVGNTNIDEKTSLNSALSKSKVGDTVTLTVLRDGKQQTIKVTLAAQSQE